MQRSRTCHATSIDAAAPSFFRIFTSTGPALSLGFLGSLLLLCGGPIGSSAAEPAGERSAPSLVHGAPELPLAFAAIPLAPGPGPDGEPESHFVLLRHRDHHLRIDGGQMVLTRTHRSTPADSEGREATRRSEPERLTLSFLGADPEVRPEGRRRLQGVASFYRGSDPARWIEGAATYGAVAQVDLYPGITQLTSTAGGEVKNEFFVSPGADPEQIKMAYSGASGVRLEDDGELVLSSGAGEWRESPPIAFQEIGSRRVPVAASFELLGEARDGSVLVGFDLGPYDPRHELIIDPVLYSIYVGGSENETAFSMATDPDGHVYFCGTTTSTDFPVVNPVQMYRDAQDFFLAKLSPDGSTLLYSTHFGGSARELGASVAVDADGQAFCAGWTASNDLPTTPGAYQEHFSGAADDAAVFKLDPNGALLAATYLGGLGDDQPEDLEIDPQGNVYLLGNTNSNTYPTTVGPPLAGSWDLFVTKIDNSLGPPLVYSKFVGGSGFEWPTDLALDSQNSAYVVGRTESSDFPIVTAPGAGQVYDSIYDGADTVFLTKLDPTGSAIAYSTFLDGTTSSSAWISVDVDRHHQAYVATAYEGNGFSATPPGVLGPMPAGQTDGVVMKVEADGSGLVYSTFLGGSGEDRPTSVIADRAGRAHVVGATDSTDFPLLDPLSQYSGGQDIFLTEIDADGQGYRFSTYFGGSLDDAPHDVAFGPCRICLVGRTSSLDFFPNPGPPVVLPLKPQFGGGLNDAFVTCWHLQVFADGFESGDASAWSLVIQ